MGLKIDCALLSQRRSKEIQRRKARIQVQNATRCLTSRLKVCGATSRGHSTSQERCIFCKLNLGPNGCCLSLFQQLSTDSKYQGSLGLYP